jgi:hypothetical protein
MNTFILTDKFTKKPTFVRSYLYGEKYPFDEDNPNPFVRFFSDEGIEYIRKLNPTYHIFEFIRKPITKKPPIYSKVFGWQNWP